MWGWFSLPPEMHALIRARSSLRALHALSLTCTACRLYAPDVTLPEAWRGVIVHMATPADPLIYAAESGARAGNRLVLWTFLESPWRAWPGFESGTLYWTRDRGTNLIDASIAWYENKMDSIINRFHDRYLSRVRVFIKEDGGDVDAVRCESYFSWTFDALRMTTDDVCANYKSASSWTGFSRRWLAEIKHRMTASVERMKEFVL